MAAEGIYCADCWMNPRTWYLQPKCTFDYLLRTPNSLENYRRVIRDLKDEIYFILERVTKVLVVCEGCNGTYAESGEPICKPCKI